jgi:hypothetical protein
LNPENILARIADRYLNCRTYSDCGVVDFETVEGKPGSLEFRTQFIRPEYYSFEWQDYGPRRGKSEDFALLWSSAGETYVRHRWGLEREESLGLAVAGATGCSSGVASIIPPLLLPSLRVNCRNLLELVDLQLLRNETFESEECHVLQGCLQKKGDHILWVSTRNDSIRHIFDDRSWTADESRRDHEKMIADTKLMAELAEKGLTPPLNMEHTDKRFVLEFTFRDIHFDAPIEPRPRPTSSN